MLQACLLSISPERPVSPLCSVSASPSYVCSASCSARLLDTSRADTEEEEEFYIVAIVCFTNIGIEISPVVVTQIASVLVMLALWGTIAVNIKLAVKESASIASNAVGKLHHSPMNSMNPVGDGSKLRPAYKVLDTNAFSASSTFTSSSHVVPLLFLTVTASNHCACPWQQTQRTQSFPRLTLSSHAAFASYLSPLLRVVVQEPYCCCSFAEGTSADDIIMNTGSEVGALLVDGLGDGVAVACPSQELSFLRNMSFGVLQGSRMRNTKTGAAATAACPLWLGCAARERGGKVVVGGR